MGKRWEMIRNGITKVASINDVDTLGGEGDGMGWGGRGGGKAIYYSSLGKIIPGARSSIT